MSTAAPTSNVNVAAIEVEGLKLTTGLQKLKIVGQSTYDEAVSFWTGAKEWIKRVKDDENNPAGFALTRKKTYEAYQAVLAQQRAVCQPVENAIVVVGSAITDWTREQKRLEDKLRREAEIEQQRIEEMHRQSLAVDAIDSGADQESVDAILSEPITATPVRVEPTYQRSSAISTVEKFKAQVIDLKKFVKHIAKECDKNPGLLMLLVGLKPTAPGSNAYEGSALNDMAKGQKQLLAIPGVKVYDSGFVKTNSRGK